MVKLYKSMGQNQSTKVDDYLSSLQFNQLKSEMFKKFKFSNFYVKKWNSGRSVFHHGFFICIFKQMIKWK